MANFYVTHHRYPSNPQLFAVSLHKVAGVGVDENNPNFKPTYRLAERTWKIFIYTSGLDTNGDPVQPVVGGIFGSADDVNQFVENKIAQLCSTIDWSQQGTYTPQGDAGAPYVSEQYPTQGQVAVPISSPVVIRVKDIIPGVGIDPSTVSMTIDGFEVEPTFTGNKYDMTFTFRPRPIFFE
jgi:hypothetical protein